MLISSDNRFLKPKWLCICIYKSVRKHSFYFRTWNQNIRI